MVLNGDIRVFKWPAARPFLAANREALAPHYPVDPDRKLLLAFPRLFIVATRCRPHH